MDTLQRSKIIQLVKKEVIPAMGCTEPIAVALAVAKAKELLGYVPERIEVNLSANVLKNAMGVGIPGTGMIGLPIAIALGALVGKSEYLLEVLQDITPEAVEKGQEYIAQKRIQINQKKDSEDNLYIEVLCCHGDEKSKAIIVHSHTNFVYLSKNEQVLLNSQKGNKTDRESKDPKLTMAKVYEFATTAPLQEIEFIEQTATLNQEVARLSLEENYGHCLGRTIEQNSASILGNSIYSKILSQTAAACDARMAGAKLPVMSNSGSGNQGIAATLPVCVYAQETRQSREKLLRALMLSHLIVIYTKQYLGKLSALCGCVVAASGSSCGITFLMGGDYKQICYAVKNMIANITGMICDGAKPSCSLKIATGVSTAVLSAMLAIDNKYVTAVEGIIDDDIDKCVKNLAIIGTQGMCETDRYVLDIMTGK